MGTATWEPVTPDWAIAAASPGTTVVVVVVVAIAGPEAWRVDRCDCTVVGGLVVDVDGAGWVVWVEPDRLSTSSFVGSSAAPALDASHVPPSAKTRRPKTATSAAERPERRCAVTPLRFAAN